MRVRYLAKKALMFALCGRQLHRLAAGPIPSGKLKHNKRSSEPNKRLRACGNELLVGVTRLVAIKRHAG